VVIANQILHSHAKDNADDDDPGTAGIKERRP